MNCAKLEATVTLLLIVLTGAAVAQADPLESGFQNPPSSARAQTWWHWMNGNITREGITADLEAMKRVGLGGAQIFNVDCGIPAGPVKFLSPEWQELMVHAAKEADLLGLELGVHNCAGWSSSGGPWITPEHAMQEVTTSEQRVTGPMHFSGALPQPPVKLGYYRDIAVLAFPATAVAGAPDGGGATADEVLYSGPPHNSASAQLVKRAALVNLTSRIRADGRLDWDVPEGAWTILRIGYTPTGRQNHPAPAEGTGLECDKLSKAALDAHWSGFVQKVLDDLGPLAGKGRTLDDVLIDSYEVGDQTWTPKFAEEFLRRRGYDPVPYLPALTGRIVENPEITQRFLWDMRRTIADLFAENYYGRFQELCHERGLEASIEPYSGPFESLQCGGKADIPMGEFWVGNTPGSSIKLAASVGHIYGQPIIGAESFTAAPSRRHGRWLDDAYSLKALGDRVFCEGVNRLILHRYAMQPWTNRWPGMTMGQWGTHFDRTSTWWEQGRAWLEYLARCQFLLQQGRFVADVAYFCGESAPAELRVGDPALPPGYDFDAINADVLLHQASVRNGHLVLASGMSYSVLVLPPDDRPMTPALVRKLSGFVEAGLTLVGAPPQVSPSLEEYPACDREVKDLADRMWGSCDGKTVTEHEFGKGRVVWGEPLSSVLDELRIKPDFEFSHASGAELAFIHRRIGDADIYFVSNQRARYESAECGFRVEGRMPELWNPESGEIQPAAIWRQDKGTTLVSLSFDPAGSWFVVFRKAALGDHLVAARRDSPSIPTQPEKPTKLQILKAVYGVFPRLLDVTAVVKSSVNTGRLTIRADNDLAEEDPAPGMVKCLRIDFLAGDGQKQSREAAEGSTITLPPGSQVVQASYGYVPGADMGLLDVTDKVKALIARGERQIPAENSMAGSDPAPNLVKQLRVDFRLDGRTQTAEAREGGSITVPTNAVVEKASYGRLPSETPRTNATTVDVTAKLASLVKHGELNVAVNNQLAGSDPAFGSTKELHVEYLLDGARKRASLEEGETLTLPETSQSIGTPPPFDFTKDRDGRLWMLARKAGTFTLTWASGRQSLVRDVSVPKPEEVAGPWEVRFPPGWGAPPGATFDRLESWTRNSDPGVKYFSGTATYFKDFQIPSALLATNRELWLDLGAVKNFAEVSINGRPFGVLWKPPFRVNVTAAVKPGRNTLEIKVTNLWPNRLIGDEQLPPDCEWNGKALKAWPQWLLEGKPSPTGRHTFTTWHHWTKDDALLDSGLLGPVSLQPVEESVVE